MLLFSAYTFLHFLLHGFFYNSESWSILFIDWQIDSNTDGLVDFPEFVAATLHVHQLEEHNSTKWQQRSQAAFEKFDVDRDGFITPEELKMVSIWCFLLKWKQCYLQISSQEKGFIASWMSVITILTMLLTNPTIVLQHTGLKGSIDPLLEEADIDKDGKISLSEFRRLLRTASMSSPTVRDSRRNVAL